MDSDMYTSILPPALSMPISVLPLIRPWMLRRHISWLSCCLMNCCESRICSQSYRAGDVPDKVKHIGNVTYCGRGFACPHEPGGRWRVGGKSACAVQYCSHKLVLANVRSDAAALQEVASLIARIAESWKQIEGQAMSQALLDCYKAIGAASVRMLQAAQMQDWEGIARSVKQY